MPRYAELIERYNANASKIDRLWSSTVVEMSWREDGKDRWEQGDGQLILVTPDHVSLSIGKANNTIIWAAGNTDRFWLFDFQGEKTAYVGQYKNLGKPCMEEMPLPVNPLDLIQLLGVSALPNTAGVSPAKAVEWHDGAYLVEPPGTRLRVLIDPKTALPVRIDLLDARGYSRVVAKLYEPEPIQLSGVAPGAFPKINTRIEVSLSDRPGSMSMHLSRMTDGRDAGKIDERVFDYDFMKKRRKVMKEVVLDKDCGE